MPSPDPRVVKSVSEESGQAAGEGQECCAVEAIKMQNPVKAGGTGRAESVNAKAGGTVEEDYISFKLE